MNAFNDGIIDCFIRKDELALTTDLLSYIQKLHIHYFVDMTKPFLTHLEADYKLPQSDPIFINFFYDWCRNNEIIEYYLIDKNGTFLTINKDGHAKYFLTHTDRSLETFTELYQEDKEVSSFVQSVILTCPVF